MSERYCIVIPHYRHLRPLAALLPRLVQHGLDIFVIDDASGDTIRDALAAECEQYPNVQLIARRENGGKGAAMITGLRHAAEAGYSHAISLDADGQHDPDDIPRLHALSRAQPLSLFTGRPVFGEDIPASRLYGRMLTNMLVAHGRTWDIVSQAEIVESYRELREDLDKTGQAYYLAELADRFTEEYDANAPLFELLALTLAQLGHTDDPFILLRYFELHLLSLTGFQPQIYFCVACQEPLEPVENNYFHFVDGGTLCPTHGQPRPNAEIIPLPVLKVLRYLQTEPWEKVARLQLTSATRQQVESLLLGYITFTLERQLKSVDFLRKLRRQA